MSSFALRAGGVEDKARLSLAAKGAREATPSRIMVPRMLFGCASLVLVLFGLLMIYSSSSIIGLTSKAYNNDPAYFLVRQAIFAAVGLVACVVLAVTDYHLWKGSMLKAAWAVTVFSLLIVYTPMAGHDAFGATRWISIGGFTLQPSEFAKGAIVLIGAHIAEEYYAKGTIGTGEALKLVVFGVGLPLVLILAQPDKGTTGVLVLTLLVMCYLSGVSGRSIAIVTVVVIAGALIYALKDDYSRARILTMIDPFRDEYGDGYQLTQGFYALGSGGLTGVGLGMSKQKYNYLPMAHNDFIFAVVGEELGFIGAMALLATFCLLLWAGLKIAENAPDLAGRLIAAGCTSLLVIQLLLNVSGVVGAFPLSGKPVPFVSYGGSSVISSLMLVGLVMSVSMRSTLPETSYERRRAELRLADEDSPDVGVATPRSARLAGSPVRELRVVEGGATSRRSQVRPTGRGGGDSAVGLRRIDLGPSASERLRSARSRER